MKYALILAALLLAGCSQTPQAQSVVPNVPEGVQRVGYNDVYDFKLEDGTRCVLMDGYRSGGITCNWRTTNE